MNKLTKSAAESIFSNSGLILSAASKNAIASSGLRFLDSQIVHTSEIGTEVQKQRIKLLDVTNQLVEGLSDFNENKLPANRNIVVDEVFLGYGSNAATGKRGDIDYKNLSSVFPVQLLNSVLVVRQNKREVFRQLVRNLVTHTETTLAGTSSAGYAATTYMQPRSERFVSLTEPFVLSGDIPTDIEFLMPDGVSFDPGASFDYAAVIFGGIVTFEN